MELGKRKKVLAILDSKDLYGKERANILVYDVLRRNGHEVLVLYNDLASQKFRSSISQLRSKRVAFPRKVEGPFKILKSAYRLLISNLQVVYWLLVFRPNTVLIPTELALFYLYIPLLITKATVIFRAGDNPVASKVNGVLGAIYSFVWCKIVSRNVDKFVCITNFIEAKFKSTGNLKGRSFEVIYNLPPVPDVHLKNKESNSRVGLGSETGNLVFGYIGRIVHEKGVHVLIEAVKQLSENGYEFSLVIAGSLTLDQAYSNDILEYCKKFKLQPTIKFIGEVDIIEEFYQQIDVLCVPSIYEEPSGNVIVEAKYYCRPSVIFRLGGMPELIRHEEDGYVCNNISASGIIDGLLFYLENSRKAREHGFAAKNSLKKLGLTYRHFEYQWMNILG
jgi:glycosyltransferase involved in cell wall biosynthesis